MKQFITLLVASVLLLAFLWVIIVKFGPGVNDATDHITRVYFVDNISRAHEAAIDLFNKRYKGSIEVIPVNLPFDKFSTNERKELLARSLRSKSDKLDVFAVDQIWTPRFAKWGESLQSTISAEEQNDILDYAIQTCVYEGKLVAVPLYIDIGLLYYRSDIIQRLPDGNEIEERLKKSITWEEIKSLQGRLAYHNLPYFVFQAKDYEGLVCNFFELAVGMDPSFFADNKVELRSPVAQKALNWMVQNIDRRVSPAEVADFDENLSYQYMLDKNAVFVRGWPNFVENFRMFYPDTAKLSTVRRAALPHFKGSTPTSVFGGWNLMISQSSTKKKEAMTFVRFMQGTEVQRLMFERGGYIPVAKSVYQDTVFMNRHTDLAYYRELLERGFHRPALEEYTKMSDIISYYAHRAVKKELSVDEALREADQMIRSNKVLLR